MRKTNTKKKTNKKNNEKRKKKTKTKTQDTEHTAIKTAPSKPNKKLIRDKTVSFVRLKGQTPPTGDKIER